MLVLVNQRTTYSAVLFPVQDDHQITPSHVAVNVKSSMKLVCNSNFSVWIKDTLKNQPILARSVLIIEKVSLTHNGYYFCFGNYNHSSNYFISKATVKVYGNVYVQK